MAGDDDQGQQASALERAIGEQRVELDALRQEIADLDVAGLRAEIADLRDLADTVLRAMLDRDVEAMRPVIAALLDAQSWRAA